MQKKVTIIGAGFSGLVSAFYLVRQGFSVEIHEKSDRAGGLLQTHMMDRGLAESAANGLLNSSLVAELFREIGVKPLGTLKTARQRYVFRRGSPRKWPLNFSETLRLLKVLFLYVFSRARLHPQAHESISNWGARILSPEVSQYTIETALQGVYAGEPSQMSASLVLQRLFHKGPKLSKRARPAGTVTAMDGMQEVVEKLVAYLEVKGVKFHYRSEIELQKAPHEPVVVATSAPAAAQIIKDVDASRAQALEKITLLPIATATVLFKSDAKELPGFGCLYSPAEKRLALGVLFNSCIFEARAGGCRSETWILGGASKPEAVGWSDDLILHAIKVERRALMGIESEVLEAKITRWPQAFPHYDLKMEEALPKYRENRKNIFLIGNYMGQIGLSRILENASQLPTEVSVNGVWGQSAAVKEKGL